METRTETPDRTGIFVVEDSAPIRQRLVAMLEEIDGIAVVGQAEDADSAAAGILRTRPAVVVLYILLAKGRGFDVLRAVHPRAPEIIFIVLTHFANSHYRKICMEAGASYFVDKSIEMHRVRELVSSFVPAHH
jgi:DNA-binding NarL/FixJ family response regulator